MPLQFYNSSIFQVNSALDPVDLFTAPGSTSTFQLVNKPTSELASTIQAGAVEYYALNGGFTTNAASGTFTLAQSPPVGTQIVAPGINQLVVSAFDQNTVLGVTNPRVSVIPFWMLDTTTINNVTYYPLPTYPGIFINAVQLINGVGAQPSWIQFACADASGNALTYGATGAPLYTPTISAFTTLACSVSSMASSLMAFPVVSASAFYPGDYFVIDIGSPTQEIIHIISVDSVNNILYSDTGGTTYNHYSGALIFDCGRKFWLQLTVPTNANNNQAINLYNLGLTRIGSIVARP